MGFKIEAKKTFESIKFVFNNWNYVWISSVFGIISFGILYYLLVVQVANQNIWISIMMSGALFVTLSIVSIILMSFLSAILFSMILFQFNNFKKSNKKGFFGFIGSGIAAFGVGCPTCGAFLFGLIGLPLALTYFPFKGLELQSLGILVLITSLYFTSKSIFGRCKLK
ncbi:hypothetical protein COT60_01720 [Candidatus Pacearchaeota archaeon CG09_land_8_20_14_0_10_30_9]|nr:hypothetical protein [Candidatus Pacearchaeota archaeon]OIO40502.1 MAG: hypothetical protein AUJ61_01860 [Candidatus Pacearchaeota archaeon CG1_02_30_18]PIN71232.1 MAG: hypothetical protein COV77_03095 [Candidatus Pacearchaeota archaeon CG11_big_fil_rev_8_21_14_0_20_30_13]PIO01202.1 MAG: hypothetical protein COT60_01720 [Candidatus Pacearchaeota archaeon CG09_land_8_20_14_0_10_30_9]PIZ81922.1 MAG: hypothetical protein COX98_01885 [Candidatus Pacearchaeota archaeon CG_4_10_14_0_2_um_filter_30